MCKMDILKHYGFVVGVVTSAVGQSVTNRTQTASAASIRTSRDIVVVVDSDPLNDHRRPTHTNNSSSISNSSASGGGGSRSRRDSSGSSHNRVSGESSVSAGIGHPNHIINNNSGISNNNGGTEDRLGSRQSNNISRIVTDV